MHKGTDKLGSRQCHKSIMAVCTGQPLDVRHPLFFVLLLLLLTLLERKRSEENHRAAEQPCNLYVAHLSIIYMHVCMHASPAVAATLLSCGCVLTTT